jgi:hypothetical protein
LLGKDPTPGKLIKKNWSEKEGGKSRLIWKPMMKITLILQLVMSLSRYCCWALVLLDFSLCINSCPFLKL